MSTYTPDQIDRIARRHGFRFVPYAALPRVTPQNDAFRAACHRCCLFNAAPLGCTASDVWRACFPHNVPFTCRQYLTHCFTEHAPFTLPEET